MEKVKIAWTGPYSIKSAIEKFNNYEDFGIYMITRLWGGETETLLYIGRVYGLKYGRCFADRLAEHKSWLDECRGEIRVRIGKIKQSSGKKASYKRTNGIESLLIFSHKPTENIQSTSWYYGREMRVLNLGRKGPLKTEIYSEDYREN